MQILYNLVGNSIKFTETGEIIISVEKKESAYKVFVTDTGKGMTEEQTAIIFDPFRQAGSALSRGYGGTGIGLSIAKKLVELHEGEINVESEVNVGTTFSFTLPFQENSAYYKADKPTLAPTIHVEKTGVFISATSPEKSHNGSLKQTKILIADDEHVNLQVLLNQLSMEGYDVLTASNGEEVLSIVNSEELDLVILYIMMPKMSGFEVCTLL